MKYEIGQKVYFNWYGKWKNAYIESISDMYKMVRLRSDDNNQYGVKMKSIVTEELYHSKLFRMLNEVDDE